MFDPRLRSWSALAIVLALGGCTAPGFDPSGSSLPDAGSELEIAERKRRPPADAGTTADAPPADASAPPPEPSSPGVFSCYSEATPSATCALPSQCCFTNYSAQHNGECTTSSCTWGTITCDGPEDCASGQHCCSHALLDSYNLTIGYRLACQDSACGAAPINQELCHPTATSAAGTCSTGSQCVTAFGNNNDLPRTLYICQ